MIAGASFTFWCLSWLIHLEATEYPDEVGERLDEQWKAQRDEAPWN